MLAKYFVKCSQHFVQNSLHSEHIYINWTSSEILYNTYDTTKDKIRSSGENITNNLYCMVHTALVSWFILLRAIDALEFGQT